MLNKKEQRLRRSRQTRARIAKQDVARLTVFRSNMHIYASVISVDGASVVASASTAEKEVRDQLKNGGNAAAAAVVGKRIAEKAKASPTTVVSRHWRKRLAKPASSSDRQPRNLKWQSFNLAFRTKVVTTV